MFRGPFFPDMVYKQYAVMYLMTLTLIQPASKWMHWATLRRHHMSKPADSSFSEYVIHAVLCSSDSDLFICYSVLPGNAQGVPLPSVMSSVQPFCSV